MPQDPNLYGQRPAKKQKREIPLSSSLSFTSQLSSLMSAPTTTSSSTGGGASSSGRPRPSKTKDDIFSSIKAKRKPGPSRSDAQLEDASSKIQTKACAQYGGGETGLRARATQDGGEGAPVRGYEARRLRRQG
ncbi:hypothetical protein NUW58_g7317 [Xylaria curta]|uniref:Uncharacterized protein n=1 Tax=Xylaria curta TaxID=42375 RepID=A0ACC1NJB1_9PEZI|nr:hypothetical protein NUW58_g7317 [Xylaria curta]